MRDPRHPNMFHGGLKLDGRKLESVSAALRTAPLPHRLVLPLVQHAGRAAIPIVNAGDKVLGYQEVARPDGDISCSLHAPTSSTVIGIQRLPVPHPAGLMADCLVLEPDGRNEFASNLPPLDPASLDLSTLLQRVRDAGIAGLGGAVFPTPYKLAGATRLESLTLVVNGAECEPYISCDDMLMREQANEILMGTRILLDTLGATSAIVAIERDKRQALECMQAAIDKLGDKRIRLEQIFTIYPAGGERQLVQVLSGMEVPADGLPIDIGYLCQNVATLVAIYHAVCHGRPLVSRITTVTGSGIAEPGNFLTLLGTPLSVLTDAAGGYTDKASRLIMGGPMMGIALASDEVPVVKATNCVLVMAEDEVRTGGEQMPCIRCGECEQACPAQLQPQELYWRIQGDNFAGADELGLGACIECGCCDLVCPSHIPLVQHFRYAKARVKTARIQHEQSNIARRRFENRQERLENEAARRKQRLEEKRKTRASSEQAPKAIKGEIDAILARARSKRQDGKQGDETS
jgi:electron transport complex protein RnfC